MTNIPGNGAVALAYLAGVIDSDGCIAISKYYDTKKPNRSPRYVVDLTVVNTSVRLMNWLVDNYGGSYSNVGNIRRATRIPIRGSTQTPKP